MGANNLQDTLDCVKTILQIKGLGGKWELCLVLLQTCLDYRKTRKLYQHDLCNQAKSKKLAQNLAMIKFKHVFYPQAHQSQLPIVIFKVFIKQGKKNGGKNLYKVGGFPTNFKKFYKLKLFICSVFKCLYKICLIILSLQVKIISDN